MTQRLALGAVNGRRPHHWPTEACTMSESRDFWLLLRALATELQDEGDSDYERALSLAAWLEQMPAGERSSCLAELEVVLSALCELTECQVVAALSSRYGKPSSVACACGVLTVSEPPLRMPSGAIPD